MTRSPCCDIPSCCYPWRRLTDLAGGWYFSKDFSSTDIAAIAWMIQKVEDCAGAPSCVVLGTRHFVVWLIAGTWFYHSDFHRKWHQRGSSGCIDASNRRHVRWKFHHKDCEWLRNWSSALCVIHAAISAYHRSLLPPETADFVAVLNGFVVVCFKINYFKIEQWNPIKANCLLTQAWQWSTL